MKLKWSAKSAARVTGAALTGGLAVAALAAVANSQSSIDFGDDLGKPIQEIVSLPDQTYDMACAVGLETEFGDKLEGKLLIQNQPGIEILEATNLGTGEAITSAQSGDTLSYTSKDPIGLRVHSSEPVNLLATTVTMADTADVRGLTLDECRTATNYTWLNVGSTTVGESALLTVMNPSKQASEVTLRAWTGSGSLEGAPAFTVRPNSSQTVNLAAFYPDEERLALEVHASGPGVVSTLRTAGVDGLTPRGTDQVSAVNAASTSVALVGVEKGILEPKLRLINMGEEDAEVSVQLLTEKGVEMLPGTESFIIDPGAVFQLSLDGISAEGATILVDSTEPVLASAFGHIDATKDEDDKKRADRVVWMPSTPAESFRAFLPNEGKKPEYTLFLANPGDSAIDVEVNGTALRVEAHHTRTHKIAPGVLEVSAQAPIHAGVNMRVEGAAGPIISSLALQDASSDTRTISLIAPQ
ncbi:MAG: DUF5719 family protein [Actinomycetaceae bacterium]|nr:DUF5719 family protein [Actinomycetaceae bacterium]